MLHSIGEPDRAGGENQPVSHQDFKEDLKNATELGKKVILLLSLLSSTHAIYYALYCLEVDPV